MKFHLACWIPALYFFKETDKSTSVTPAQSRNLNVECIWGDLYDHHDIWHFFSAAGLFFSFILLLVFDDGIDHVPRNRIFIFWQIIVVFKRFRPGKVVYIVYCLNRCNGPQFTYLVDHSSQHYYREKKIEVQTRLFFLWAGQSKLLTKVFGQ